MNINSGLSEAKPALWVSSAEALLDITKSDKTKNDMGGETR